MSNFRIIPAPHELKNAIYAASQKTWDDHSALSPKEYAGPFSECQLASILETWFTPDNKPSNVTAPENTPAQYIACFEGSEFLGYALLQTYAKVGFLSISDIWTSQNHRQKGVATALIAAAQKNAQLQDLPLLANVARWNTASLRSFEKAGFIYYHRTWRDRLARKPLWLFYPTVPKRMQRRSNWGATLLWAFIIIATGKALYLSN